MNVKYICGQSFEFTKTCASSEQNQTHDAEQRRHSTRRSKKELKRSAPVRNLACGDHEVPTKEQDFSSSKNKSDVTTIEYKNSNYGKSNSSSDSTVKVNLKTKKSRSKLTSQRSNIIPRPIICPHCKKMITTTTIYQHFQFEHPKLPMLPLPSNLAQAIQLSISTIAPETHCAAIFWSKGLCNSMSPGDTFPLLLMTARMNTNQSKNMISKCKCCQRSKSSTNAGTQTDLSDAKSNQSLNRNKLYTVLNDSPTVVKYQPCEVLVMWIVTIEDNDNIYNISISDEDRTCLYSYTGKAINIKDEQFAPEIYQRAECLIIHGQAINKVISDQFLLVSVTMIPKIENKVVQK